MTKHTPGPWTIEKDAPSLKSLGKMHTFEIGGERSITWNCQVLADENGEANARLIAAAPELLESLESLFEHCAMVHKHWGEGSNQKEANAAIEAAKAAIKKARGEQ